jgi:hypothetical protein
MKWSTKSKAAVIQSFEPNEYWKWYYVDDTFL